MDNKQFGLSPIDQEVLARVKANREKNMSNKSSLNNQNDTPEDTDDEPITPVIRFLSPEEAEAEKLKNRQEYQHNQKIGYQKRKQQKKDKKQKEIKEEAPVSEMEESQTNQNADTTKGEDKRERLAHANLSCSATGDVLLSWFRKYREYSRGLGIPPEVNFDGILKLTYTPQTKEIVIIPTTEPKNSSGSIKCENGNVTISWNIKYTRNNGTIHLPNEINFSGLLLLLTYDPKGMQLCIKPIETTPIT